MEKIITMLENFIICISTYVIYTELNFCKASMTTVIYIRIEVVGSYFTHNSNIKEMTLRFSPDEMYH